MSPGHIKPTTSADVFKISKFAIGFWSIERVKESVDEFSHDESTETEIL